jgi:hypothetical protein
LGKKGFEDGAATPIGSSISAERADFRLNRVDIAAEGAFISGNVCQT